MSERDKFLTEAMDRCWHSYRINKWRCDSCGDFRPRGWTKQASFSTWIEFGNLWEWSQEQEWFVSFLNIMDVGEYITCGDGTWTFDLQKEFVDPDIYANTVYKFLKLELK